MALFSTCLPRCSCWDLCTLVASLFGSLGNSLFDYICIFVLLAICVCLLDSHGYLRFGFLYSEVSLGEYVGIGKRDFSITE